MRRGWRPVLAGAVVVVAVFLLAQWPIFEPSSTPEQGGTLIGGAERGAVLFANECAGCHGQGGVGGTGPALVGSGLDEGEIAATIARGSGIMPPAIVTGQNAADVAAYVATIANP
jgi:mono/diheme cytochrome c family protein